jgi:hypothetical protein
VWLDQTCNFGNSQKETNILHGRTTAVMRHHPLEEDDEEKRTEGESRKEKDAQHPRSHIPSLMQPLQIAKAETRNSPSYARLCFCWSWKIMASFKHRHQHEQHACTCEYACDCVLLSCSVHHKCQKRCCSQPCSIHHWSHSNRD